MSKAIITITDISDPTLGEGLNIDVAFDPPVKEGAQFQKSSHVMAQTMVQQGLAFHKNTVKSIKAENQNDH